MQPIVTKSKLATVFKQVYNCLNRSDQCQNSSLKTEEHEGECLRYWFTHYPKSDWTPGKGYNEYYLNQVRLLRNRFQLIESVDQGKLEGTGVWVPHLIQNNKILVYARIRELDWMAYYTDGTRFGPSMEISLQVKPVIESKILIFDEIISILFPTHDFPCTKPTVRINNREFYSKRNCQFVLSSGGTTGNLCLFSGVRDWVPADDVRRCVEATVSWVVANEKQLLQIFDTDQKTEVE